MKPNYVSLYATIHSKSRIRILCVEYRENDENNQTFQICVGYWRYFYTVH